jgi:alpha-tubulin suppressor-like RCC1 family protein
MRRTPLKFLALFGLTVWLGACGGGGSSSSTASTTTGSTTSGGSTTTAFALGAVKSAGAGANETYAIRGTGVSYQWGDNTWGQLGDGTQNNYGPVLLDTAVVTTATSTSATTTTTPPAAWKSIAAGGSHTLAIKTDGTLWAWGLNLNGQLGDGNSGAGRYVTSPEQIGAAKDWLAVAAGDAHSVALEGTTAPIIMAWGQNAYGQLGLGTTAVTPVVRTDVSVPTKTTKALVMSNAVLTLSASPFTGTPWKSIAAGGNHNIVMRSDGLLFSWGDNTYGQLGQSLGNASVPTQLAAFGAGTLGALAVASGRNHALAILTDHTLFGWGSNTNGQLGDGTTTNRATAVRVGSDSDWYTVAAGGAHTLAIKTDRTLWAWGSNSDGQLGHGSQSDSLVPKQVGTAANWVAVSAGRSHSLAIASDGTLWIWGRNAEGQLGTGKTGDPVLSPTLLP